MRKIIIPQTGIYKLSRFGVAAFALVAAAGCIFGPPPPPPGEFNRETPNGVLDYIEMAYNTGNINAYKESLTSNFVFYFNPEDIGQIINGYEIPVSWTYTEDRTATESMFDEAYSISLAIDPIPKPDEGATEYSVENVKINLVVMENETKGYRADKGWCDFYFEKQPNDLWCLVKWWDHTHD